MAQKSPLTALTVMYADRWNGTWFIELEDFRHQLMIEYHLRFLITSFLRLKRQWLFFLSINKSGGFYFFQIATLNYLFTQQVKLPLPKNKILKKNLLMWSGHMKKEKLLQDPRLTRIFKIKIPDNKKRMPYQKAVIWYNLKNQAVVVASNYLNFEKVNNNNNKRLMSWLYNSKVLFLRYYYNSLVKFYYPVSNLLFKNNKNGTKLLTKNLSKNIRVRSFISLIPIIITALVIVVPMITTKMLWYAFYTLLFMAYCARLVYWNWESIQNHLKTRCELAQLDKNFGKRSHRYYDVDQPVKYKRLLFPGRVWTSITLRQMYVPKLLNEFINFLICFRSLNPIKLKEFPGIFRDFKLNATSHPHPCINVFYGSKDVAILPDNVTWYAFSRSFKDEPKKPLPLLKSTGIKKSNILNRSSINDKKLFFPLNNIFNSAIIENSFWKNKRELSNYTLSNHKLMPIEKSSKKNLALQTRKLNDVLLQPQINKFFFTPLQKKIKTKNLGLYQMVARIPIYYFQRIYFYKKFPTLKLGFQALLKKYGHQLKFTHMERRLGSSLLFLTTAIQRVVHMRFFFSYVPTQWYRNDYRFLKRFVIFERYGSKRYFVSTVSLIHLAMSRGSATLLTDLLVRKLRKIQKHTLFLDCVEKLCRYFMAAFESSKAYPYSLCKGIEILFTGKLNGKERSNAWRFKLGPVHTSTFYTNTREEQAKCMTRYGMFNIRVRLKLGQIKNL